MPPFVAWELPSGNSNLPMAAGVVAALRGEPCAAELMALAKLSRAHTVRREDWREALAARAVARALTLPWLWLWPTCVGRLVAAMSPPCRGRCRVRSAPRAA